MLLRIVDSVQGNNVELIFTDDDKSESFIVDTYDSPFTANFKKKLTWYFQNYPFLNDEISDGQDVIEKTIKNGQYLGDYLLGEDQQLFKWIHQVEKKGYQKLCVSVESSREEFFEEMWEFLVLPDSKFMLSAAIESFVRCYRDSDRSSTREKNTVELPEIVFDLQVTPPLNDALSELNGVTGDQAASSPQDASEDSPLDVLHLIIRPDGFNYSSSAYQTSIDLLAAEGAINYQVHGINGRQALELALGNNRAHIVHLDCPVVIDSENGEAIEFLLGDAEKDKITVPELVSALKNNKVPVLCIDGHYVLKPSNSGDAAACTFAPYPAYQGLSRIAKQAAIAGFGNIVGLAHEVDSWISSRCFSTLYQSLTKAFSLSQAIVESRKELQRSLNISRFTISEKPFHFWSLLIHYGGQEVRFFDTPQFSSSVMESQTGIKRRQILHGFDTSLFPPGTETINDNGIFDVKRCLNNQKITVLIGHEGSGKTHLSHQLAFYLAQAKEVSYGFYFDCARDSFTKDIILEMIAPIFELPPEDKEKIENALTSLSCYFVFESLFESEHDKKDDGQDLSTYIQTLRTQGHKILITGQTDTKAFVEKEGDNYQSILVKDLEELETRVLAIQQAKINSIEADAFSESWPAIDQPIINSPFLVNRSIALLANYSAQDLAKELHEHIDMSRPVTTYFHWQFANLPLVWKFLLVESTKVGSLLWETLMIACNQAPKDDSVADKKNGGEAKEHPWDTLLKLSCDDSDHELNEFSAGIERLQKSGFLQRQEQGHVIAGDARSFLLNNKDKETLTFSAREDVLLSYSQILSQGIALLSQHLSKQQNPALSHHLLANRRFYVTHFERLWFAKDYSGFMRVKNAFSQLLMLAKLGDEIEHWLLDLMSRSDMNFHDKDENDKDDVGAKIAWLSVASSSMSVADAEKQPYINKAVDDSLLWLKGSGKDIEVKDVPLFQHVASFLEKFYLKTQNWNACIEVMSIAQKAYKKIEAWHWYIQTLKTSATCYVASADNAKALEIEQKILEDIPYEKSPAGFEVQQMLAILIARVSRGDSENGQLLLNKMIEREDVENLKESLDVLQADIYFQQKDYKNALRQFCGLWQRSLKLENQQQLLQLKAKFAELSKFIGEKEYKEIFIETTQEDTIFPEDYVPQDAASTNGNAGVPIM